MTVDPAALLRRHQDRLIDEWMRSAGRIAPTLTRRPPAELRAAGREFYGALAPGTRDLEPAGPREGAVPSSVAGLLRGNSLPDVVRGLTALRNQMLDLLEEHMSDFPDLWRVSRRIMAAGDELLAGLAARHPGTRPPGGAGSLAAGVSTAVLSAGDQLGDVLSAEVRRALRFRRPLALLLVQVDGYEDLVRLYGHAVAEATATAVGEALDRLTREVDYRVGPHDGIFSLILPESDLLTARAVAERIRLAGEAGEGTNHTLTDRPTTVSIGLAAFPLHADNGPLLLAASRDALLQAQRMGGNAVVVVEASSAGMAAS